MADTTTKSTTEQGQLGSATRQVRENRSETNRESEWKAAKERGAELVGEARETVNQAYQRASESMSKSLDQAIGYGKENPGKATLIAFGAGIGVGFIIASNFSGRSRSRRMVPPVMNAISQIAKEFFR